MPATKCAKIDLDTSCVDGLFLQASQCQAASFEISVCCGGVLKVLDAGELLVFRSECIDDLAVSTNPFTLDLTAENTMVACGQYDFTISCRDASDNETVIGRGVLSIV